MDRTEALESAREHLDSPSVGERYYREWLPALFPLDSEAEEVVKAAILAGKTAPFLAELEVSNEWLKGVLAEAEGRVLEGDLADYIPRVLKAALIRRGDDAVRRAVVEQADEASLLLSVLASGHEDGAEGVIRFMQKQEVFGGPNGGACAGLFKRAAAVLPANVVFEAAEPWRASGQRASELLHHLRGKVDPRWEDFVLRHVDSDQPPLRSGALRVLALLPFTASCETYLHTHLPLSEELVLAWGHHPVVFDALLSAEPSPGWEWLSLLSTLQLRFQFEEDEPRRTKFMNAVRCSVARLERANDVEWVEGMGEMSLDEGHPFPWAIWIEEARETLLTRDEGAEIIARLEAAAGQK